MAIVSVEIMKTIDEREAKNNNNNNNNNKNKDRNKQDRGDRSYSERVRAK